MRLDETRKVDAGETVYGKRGKASRVPSMKLPREMNTAMAAGEA